MYDHPRYTHVKKEVPPNNTQTVKRLCANSLVSSMNHGHSQQCICLGVSCAWGQENPPMSYHFFLIIKRAFVTAVVPSWATVTRRCSSIRGHALVDEIASNDSIKKLRAKNQESTPSPFPSSNRDWPGQQVSQVNKVWKTWLELGPAREVSVSNSLVPNLSAKSRNVPLPLHSYPTYCLGHWYSWGWRERHKGLDFSFPG